MIVFRTEVFRHIADAVQNMILAYGYLTGKDSWQGAQTSIYLALQPGLEKESGGYFADCRNWNFLLSKWGGCYWFFFLTKYCRKQTDPELASGLWERSAKLVMVNFLSWNNIKSGSFKSQFGKGVSVFILGEDGHVRQDVPNPAAVVWHHKYGSWKVVRNHK